MSDADADSGAISSFVAFVLEEVCGLDASIGAWTRGQQRRAFLGAARNHRRDGEASSSVDRP